MDRELVHRMKSIRQTVQISSAQKLIAASQIGKARRKLRESEPYHARIRRAIADVLRCHPVDISPYIDTGVTGRRGLLVFSANRGLAGGFNSNVIHFTEQSLKEKPADYIAVLGNACRNHLLKSGYPVDADYDPPLEPPAMYVAGEIAEKITGMLERREVASFDIIYTRYRSSVRMEPVQSRLFPVNPAEFEEYAGDKSGYGFEPSFAHLLANLMLKYLKGFLFGCLINTHICELTSRLTAMDSAIRNGNEMLDRLSLIYNRARQSAITQEITEIVAGAAALGGEV